MIEKINMLGTSVDVHYSFTDLDAIGQLYLGYTINTGKPELAILEAIIHEYSHNKLGLFLQFDEIVLNDKEQHYYSAIRPDARHIFGIFVGYHAFAPTIYIMMKAYLSGILGNDKEVVEKLVLYYIKTKFLQKVIKKHANLTDLGKEISKEIDYVILIMDVLLKKINPPTKLVLKCKKIQQEHFENVNKNYINLKY